MTKFCVLFFRRPAGRVIHGLGANHHEEGRQGLDRTGSDFREANLKWLCQGKYYKPKRQDCVDMRAKYWDDQFFEMNPGASGTQTKAQMVQGQTPLTGNVSPGFATMCCSFSRTGS